MAVHVALRELLRKVRGERLTTLERRVLDGVIELTVTWCRLSDRVTVGQIVAAADVKRERTVREILARLAERDLLAAVAERLLDRLTAVAALSRIDADRSA